MAPLIGQNSVSVTLLTNQLFVWVYLNSGPDLSKRVPSSDREREELSIDVKHNSVRWNEKKLQTIKNVVSYAVLHHMFGLGGAASTNAGSSASTSSGDGEQCEGSCQAPSRVSCSSSSPAPVPSSSVEPHPSATGGERSSEGRRPSTCSPPAKVPPAKVPPATKFPVFHQEWYRAAEWNSAAPTPRFLREQRLRCGWRCPSEWGISRR